MNNFFKTFFACLLAIFAGSIISTFFWFIIIGSVVSIIGSSDQTFTLKENTILKIDLSVPLVEKQSSNPLEGFDYTTFKVKQNTTLLEAVALINKASYDPNINGIYLNIPGGIPSSMSALYELREALARFRRESGKFVISYADVLSQGGYYLASVSDKIYLNPQGAMDWSGMSASVMFYKGLLDKLGIEPEIVRHGKFKGAVEPFLLDKLSAENRLQMESMVNSVWGYVVGEISRSRGLDSTKLQLHASELSVSTAAEALGAGMVDSLFYRDQLMAELTRLSLQDDEPRFASLTEYKWSGVSTSGDVLSANKIAVLYADGEIVDGGDSNTQIVGNSLAEEIAKIRRDKSVKALVIRVNSPGGSVLASDIIWREVALAKSQFPVIVSMGAYAASGGYYISCPADVIVTTPTTLTGSIGVFGLMFNAEKAAREKLGITVDIVKTNPSADMGTPFRGLTAAERTFLQNSVDSVYTRFVTLVSQGRNMNYNNVDSLASGRVWTGLQATRNGLADRIGTLTDAIDLAVERAGIVDYRLKSYPEIDNSFASLFSSFANSSSQYILSKIGIIKQIDDLSKQSAEILSKQGIRAEMEQQIQIAD